MRHHGDFGFSFLERVKILFGARLYIQTKGDHQRMLKGEVSFKVPDFCGEVVERYKI